MAFIKFNFLLILLSGSVMAETRFSPKSCLDSTYLMKMTQKGPLFGLLKHEFVIDKKACNIHITHRKYLPKEWIVDVCREPVHIKVTSATGVDVAKKETDCFKNGNSKDVGSFCTQFDSLMDVIQDDGLIFAEGDRDDLNSDHGKTFCSYLLLKRYLNDSIVFSRYTDVPDIFSKKKRARPKVVPEAPAAPKKEDQEASVKDLLLPSIQNL